MAAPPICARDSHMRWAVSRTAQWSDLLGRAFPRSTIVILSPLTHWRLMQWGSLHKLQWTVAMKIAGSYPLGNAARPITGFAGGQTTCPRSEGISGSARAPRRRGGHASGHEAGLGWSAPRWHAWPAHRRPQTAQNDWGRSDPATHSADRTGKRLPPGAIGVPFNLHSPSASWAPARYCCQLTHRASHSLSGLWESSNSDSDWYRAGLGC